MDEQRARLRRLILIFFAAAFIRLIYWTEIRSTELDRWHEWDQSDMQTYIEQARRIAEGDWLARDPYHPYHLWQRTLPESDWLAFYPPHSFHQAPAYSYALAVLHPLAPRDLPAMKLLQILLGALACVLLHEIARALGGPLAGHIAGAIAALYGPVIQIELQILREGPMIFLLCATLAMLFLHSKRSLKSGLDSSGCKRRAFLGATLGAMTLLHETGQVAFAAAVASVACIHGFVLPPRRNRRLEALGAIACLGVGFALCYSPLVARNLAVGSPALTLSSRSSIIFAMSNHAQATEGGAGWGETSGVLPMIKVENDKPKGGVFRKVLDSYAGREHLIIRNIWLKFRSVVAVRESPDNTSYSFYQERSAVLRWLPAFWLIFAPACGGLAMLLWEWRRSRLADPSSPPDSAKASYAITFAIFFLAFLAALSLAHTRGRHRLCIVPILIPLAAVFFAQFITLLRARTLRRATAGIVCFALAVILQVYAQLNVEESGRRATDYVVAANLNRKVGELELAADDYARAIELGATSPAIYRALGETLAALGRLDDAAPWFALAEMPSKGDGDLNAK